MRRVLTAVAVAASAAAFAAAGCGGGGDSTTDALTTAQYLKQADAICGKTEGRQLARMQALNQDSAPVSNEELVKEAGVPPLRTQVEELSELEPSPQVKKQANAFLAALDKGVRETEEDPSKLLDFKKNPFIKSQELAEGLGLQVCGGA